MAVPRLILASASPRRRDLMQEAGYAFEIVPALDVEEIHDESLPLPALTEENARLKAAAVAREHPDAVVIGADTLVSIDDRSLGKPVDLADAFRMAKMLTGRTHEVCTGVCLARGEAPEVVTFHEITHVTFKCLSDREIEEYLGLIEPLDKAGAYAAQDHGSMIIERTEGSWTNVVGLPMERLARELTAFGGGTRD